MLLLLLCLSFTTVTQATHIAGIGQYISVVDFSDFDSSDKNDQVDDDNVLVALTSCHFDQFKTSNQVPNEAGYYLAYAFVRPLTRAPPKVIF